MSDFCRKASDSSKKILESDPCDLSDSSKWKPGIYLVNHIGGIPLPTIIPGDLCADEFKDILNFYLDPDGTNVTIDTIAVYRTPLEGDSIGKKVLNWTKPGYHGYVCLRVKVKDRWRYFSLDKHTDGLSIQVSKERNDVLLKFRGNPRNGVPEEIIADKGSIKVRELTNFIVKKSFIKEGYNAWKGNHCKQFSKDIFDEVATVSRYYWEGDERKLKLKAVLSFVSVSAVAVIGLATGGVTAAAGAVVAAAGTAATAAATAAAAASETSVVVGGAAGAAVVAGAASASEASGAAACAAGAATASEASAVVAAAATELATPAVLAATVATMKIG